jgi:hypothetical protein
MKLQLLVFVAAFASYSNAHADIFLFDASTGSVNLQHLPDAPGDALDDSISPFLATSLCPSMSLCSILVSATDGLTPSNILGFVVVGDPTTRLIQEEIDYYAKKPYSPDYTTRVFTGGLYDFICPPSVCPNIISETSSLQTLLTIPWLNSSGDIVRVDTFEIIAGPPFVPPIAPEPTQLSFELLCAGIGGLILRKRRTSPR